MQKSGSKPIGIGIAVIVIALCVYGAIQLASSNNNDTAPSPTPNQPTVTEQPTPPIGNTSEDKEVASNTNDRSTNDNERPSQAASEPDASTDDQEDEAAVGAEGSLPSTGPAWFDGLLISVLLLSLRAYLRSRQRLTTARSSY